LEKCNYKNKTYNYYIINTYIHYNINKIITDTFINFFSQFIDYKKPTIGIIFGQNDIIKNLQLDYNMFIKLLFNNIQIINYNKFFHLTQYFTNILQYKYIIDFDTCTLSYYDYSLENYFTLSFTLLYFRFYNWYINITKTIQELNIIKYDNIFDSDNDF
jgi:hypothetical protein